MEFLPIVFIIIFFAVCYKAGNDRAANAKADMLPWQLKSLEDMSGPGYTKFEANIIVADGLNAQQLNEVMELAADQYQRSTQAEILFVNAWKESDQDGTAVATASHVDGKIQVVVL
jgi:hypothetical protein